MAEHELVIRGGRVVDGSGAAARVADIAVDAGRITAVGSGIGRGHREMAAEGLLVTPGFVDIHTHYDAQATWDPMFTPSSLHGVTSVVMGNCGVGFAPVRESERQELIELMEAVEDIPGTAMHEGIEWEWESFPEFMAALERRPHAIDFGLQVPHCALRAYVMGRRGTENRDATPADIEAMRGLVEEGLRAGALGFSTSRTELHKTLAGDPVPGTMAAHEELLGIGRGFANAGGGVFQLAATHREVLDELPWMKQLARETGATVAFNLQQVDEAPDLYREVLGKLEEAHADGVTTLRGQFAGRPVGVLMGWQSTVHPFRLHPAYREIERLPIEERLVELRRPERREALTRPGSALPAEMPRRTVVPLAFLRFLLSSFHKMYPLGSAPDYEPAPETSIALTARRGGRGELEIAYEAMMADEGNGLLYFPLFGYSTGRFDAIEECLTHPLTGLSLSDAGAHCGVISDASSPTFMLTHWARDRSRGERMPLEFIVKRQTLDTARQWGLGDRGLLAPGQRADINVIDFEALAVESPRFAFDLPAGGRRLMQGARGYRCTLVRGVPIMEAGEPTGETPGALIRGRRSA